MGGEEGGNLSSGGETPGGICNSVPLDSLCHPGDVAPAGLAFFQRATPGSGYIFTPLDVSLMNNFLPALFGCRIEDITDSLRKCTT